MLTMQEIFTKVVVALRKQGEKSLNEFGACVYRGENERKCAAGHLIDDVHYTPDLESWGVSYKLVQAALTSSGVDMANTIVYNLLDSLQTIHDNFSPAQWEPEWLGVISHFKFFDITLSLPTQE